MIRRFDGRFMAQSTLLNGRSRLFNPGPIAINNSARIASCHLTMFALQPHRDLQRFQTSPRRQLISSRSLWANSREEVDGRWEKRWKVLGIV